MSEVSMRAAIAIAGLVLTACGGGGETNAPDTASIQVPQVIEISGDSTAHGNGATVSEWTPPYLLRAAFPSIVVVDTSLSGSTSSDRITGEVVRGQGTRFKPFPNGVVGTVYLTNWGVNDAAYGTPLADYKANLRKIGSVPGAIFMTPVPSTNVDDSPYAQAMREVAVEIGVDLIDVNAYVLGLANWRVLEADGTHPGDALYRMIYAQVVVPEVTRVLCRTRSALPACS